MMNKSLAFFKRAAFGARMLLMLFLIAGMVIAFLAVHGVTLQIDQIGQFLLGQNPSMLLLVGVLACAFIYLLARSIIYDNRGDTNTGLAYCYGHRQMQKPYYEQGALTFDADQLTFKPDNNGSSAFTLPYNRIIRSESEWDDISIKHALFSYDNREGIRPTYNVSIRFKNNDANECVLEIRLPRYTRMMAVVKQKLFSGKVETKSCTA
jgi:ABC-type Fe3+-siderophore transport system permease subunit